MPSAPQPPAPPPERQETDKSLRVEREKTDDELGKREAATEESSDAAVQLARGEADEVLAAARGRADEALVQEGASRGERQALGRERKQEDSAVAQERRNTDEELTEERQEGMRALANLLRLEREQTDGRLLVERARGDAALAARDDFMGMVSHDLRTLLGNIALTADLQIRTATDDEAGRRALAAAERIQRYTARINRLVGDLVDVASIEAGRFAIVQEAADVRALVGDSLEAFQPTASAKGVSLEAAAGSDPLPARCDPGRILQVLANLLSNAIRFTEEGGTVSVAAAATGTEVRLTVTDTGVGIAAQHLEAIFERFWQVARADRRGLGLGLFICRCIVEAHGGRIWAESEAGKGSRISFTVPRAPASRPTANAAPPLPGVGGPIG